MPGLGLAPEQRARIGSSLIRISVGVEDAEDLRDELEHALIRV